MLDMRNAMISICNDINVKLHERKSIPDSLLQNFNQLLCICIADGFIDFPDEVDFLWREVIEYRRFQVNADENRERVISYTMMYQMASTLLTFKVDYERDLTARQIALEPLPSVELLKRINTTPGISYNELLGYYSEEQLMEYLDELKAKDLLVASNMFFDIYYVTSMLGRRLCCILDEN